MVEFHVHSNINLFRPILRAYRDAESNLELGENWGTNKTGRLKVTIGFGWIWVRGFPRFKVLECRRKLLDI